MDQLGGWYRLTNKTNQLGRLARHPSYTNSHRDYKAAERMSTEILFFEGFPVEM